MRKLVSIFVVAALVLTAPGLPATKALAGNFAGGAARGASTSRIGAIGMQMAPLSGDLSAAGLMPLGLQTASPSLPLITGKIDLSPGFEPTRTPPAAAAPNRVLQTISAPAVGRVKIAQTQKAGSRKSPERSRVHSPLAEISHSLERINPDGDLSTQKSAAGILFDNAADENSGSVPSSGAVTPRRNNLKRTGGLKKKVLPAVMTAAAFFAAATPAFAGDGQAVESAGHALDLAAIAASGGLLAGAGLLRHYTQKYGKLTSWMAKGAAVAAGIAAGFHLPIITLTAVGLGVAAAGMALNPIGSLLRRKKSDSTSGKVMEVLGTGLSMAGAGMLISVFLQTTPLGMAAMTIAGGISLILGIKLMGRMIRSWRQSRLQNIDVEQPIVSSPAAAREVPAAVPQPPSFLDRIIRLALRNRWPTAMFAAVMLAFGTWTASRLPVDVFPDLDRPRTTVLTYAPGYSPTEVERLVTFPLETALNGATGVQTVRSQSGAGLSVLLVEFDWGTNRFNNRQIVSERLAQAAPQLPKNINQPFLAPMSSIMGQIMIIGVDSESGATSGMELRSVADWDAAVRLRAIPGVSQVVTIGGERKQYQVLINPGALRTYDVTLEDVESALKNSNWNAAGGYVNEGLREFLVRGEGLVQSLDDLKQVVVRPHAKRSVLIEDLARVVEGAAVKRGDASVNGNPGVLLIVTKQPGADTRALTTQIEAALVELDRSLPEDIRFHPNIYQQKEFIDRSISNVNDALMHGGFLVALILLLFLRSGRSTVVTMTAIPLSIGTTAIIFKALGMGINTMTLGGLALAIGELVDDSIVDQENIHRRLRENAQLEEKKKRSPLRVVYEASREVRGTILYSTILVVLSTLPLLALGGLEGRLFTPLLIAYAAAIVVSTLVSLTVTPVLSYWLFGHAKSLKQWKENFLVRRLKNLAGKSIRFSLRRPKRIVAGAMMLAFLSLGGLAALDRTFLPPFNEGTVQVNLITPPGTSLEGSNKIVSQFEQRLKNVPGIVAFGRRTGRAEGDEHTEPVSNSEIIITFDPKSPLSRADTLDQIRGELDQIPGIVYSVEQPLSHMISHMLSGVKAQVGIKVFGDDLGTLRRIARDVKTAVSGIDGVIDALVEPQVDVPQFRIVPDRAMLARYGLSITDVNDVVSTALNGEVLSKVYEGQRQFDLLLRVQESERNPESLGRIQIRTPAGEIVALSDVARIIEDGGPNTIKREGVRRRIVVSFNIAGGHALGKVAGDAQEKIAAIKAKLPAGYSIDIDGQYKNQQSALLRILLLGLGAFAAMYMALFMKFKSHKGAIQVMATIPLAAVGATAALILTGQAVSVASLVGLIALAGIASRNVIMLLSHYRYLMKHEGEDLNEAMLVRAGKERLSPVLMTALTTGLGLAPLLLAAGVAGKEILYPIATVVVGGLISATLLVEFLVTPALFWLMHNKEGRASAAAKTEAEDDLED